MTDVANIEQRLEMAVEIYLQKVFQMVMVEEKERRGRNKFVSAAY